MRAAVTQFLTEGSGAVLEAEEPDSVGKPHRASLESMRQQQGVLRSGENGTSPYPIFLQRVESHCGERRRGQKRLMTASALNIHHLLLIQQQMLFMYHILLKVSPKPKLLKLQSKSSHLKLKTWTHRRGSLPSEAAFLIVDMLPRP